MSTQDNRVNKSKAFGIASLVLGIIGIFIFSIVLCPLAIIFGIVSIVKKEYIFSIIGIICAIIGLFTSPMFWAMLGGLGLAAGS